MTRYLGLLLAGGLALAGCTALSGKHQQSAHDHAQTPPSMVVPVEEIMPASPPVVEIKTRPFPADSFYDLLVAEFALRRGEYDIALNNYQQQSHVTQDSGVISRTARLAEFLKADRIALDSAQLWAQQDPDDMEAQFLLASQLAKAGRPLEAMEPMVRVLEAGTKANFAVIAAAALQLSEAMQTQLLDQFDTLLAIHKDNAELMTGKALLLQQRGEKAEALALVRRVLDIAPDETHAIIIEAKLLEELGRSHEAFSRLEQMVDQNPYNRRMRLQYARLLTQADMKKAREQFAILVAQSPGDGDMLLSLALVSKESGAIEDAEVYFRKLLTMNQHVSEAHFYLGQIAEQRGDREEAIRQYADVPPGAEFFPALGRIINLELGAKNPEGARKQLHDLRARYPQHAVRFYLIEAEMLMQLKEYQAGSQLLTEALKKYPAQPNLLYSRSTFSERRRDIPLLEKDLRAVLAKDPDNATALNALGYALTEHSRRYEEAHELIEKALAQKPDDPAIMDSMGWVEFKLGNVARARELLEKAYAAFPDPEVAAHLGEVLWQAGNEKLALEIWQKALQDSPDNEVIRATMKRLAPSALPDD